MEDILNDGLWQKSLNIRDNEIVGLSTNIIFSESLDDLGMRNKVKDAFY